MTETMTATRLCLVRHGETDWNTARRVQGSIDIPLNETGRRQAAATARHLRNQHFDVIYSSDLGRALETARQIAATRDISPLIAPDLRERNYGAFQGLTHDEAHARYPQLQSRIRARELHAEPPGGESLINFAERVQAAFARIAHAHPGHTLLIVSHGGVLDVAYRMATGISLSQPRNFAICNATLNWIGFDGVNWSLHAWDERRHLDASLDEIAR